MLLLLVHFIVHFIKLLDLLDLVVDPLLGLFFEVVLVVLLGICL